MMENMLPRHMEIIYLINHHFMNVSDENCTAKFPIVETLTSIVIRMERYRKPEFSPYC